MLKNILSIKTLKGLTVNKIKTLTKQKNSIKHEINIIVNDFDIRQFGLYVDANILIGLNFPIEVGGTPQYDFNMPLQLMYDLHNTKVKIKDEYSRLTKIQILLDKILYYKLSKKVNRKRNINKFDDIKKNIIKERKWKIF